MSTRTVEVPQPLQDGLGAAMLDQNGQPILGQPVVYTYEDPPVPIPYANPPGYGAERPPRGSSTLIPRNRSSVVRPRGQKR